MKADFDPNKFGSVFSMLDSSQLAWLEGLAADPAGRQLIYQLSATHRSCLLLNFAIQKILYAGGAQPRGFVMCANVQELSTSLCLMLARHQIQPRGSCKFTVFLHCLPSPERLRSMYVVRWVSGECRETCKNRVFMLFTCHHILSLHYRSRGRGGQRRQQPGGLLWRLPPPHGQPAEGGAGGKRRPPRRHRGGAAGQLLRR